MTEQFEIQVPLETEPPAKVENTPGNSDPLAIWSNGHLGEVTSKETLDEMLQYMGIQEYGKWVFMLESSFKEVLDPTTGDSFPEMSLKIDKHEVGDPLIQFLDDWRAQATSRLLDESDKTCMLDLTLEDREIIFQLERLSNKVARVTRRGRANTIIGTKAALAKLPLHLIHTKEWMHSPRYKVVEVPDGPDGDFAILGYSGTSVYDNALNISLAPKPMKSGKYWGSIVTHNVKDYWKRII